MSTFQISIFVILLCATLHIHIVSIYIFWSSQELGLVPGTPVGTSLIDAHAGGVGVIESIPITDSRKVGRTR